MNNDRGILYIATQSGYVKEAISSAMHVKKCMPEIPLAICTNQQDLIPQELFTNIIVAEKPQLGFVDKILPLINSPFQKTLFLDTDTRVIEPVYELFDLLERFDLAVSHAPIRSTMEVLPCPESFPELNTGVICFRKTASVLDLIKNWHYMYSTQINDGSAPMHDQPAFRKALYLSNLNFTVLPPEYNLRTIMPYFAGGGLKVKILHGRGPSLDVATKTINSERNIRIGNLANWHNRLKNKFLSSAKSLCRINN